MGKKGQQYSTNPLQKLLGQQRQHVVIRQPWWNDEGFSPTTPFYLAVVLIINSIIVMPVFSRELVSSFAPSGFFVLVANFFRMFGVPPEAFFLLLTIVSLSLLPVSYFLFARKLFGKDDFSGFLATLFFILPNPVFWNVPIFVHPFLHGDGSHVVAFAFIPLFLLYFHILLRRGVKLLVFLCMLAAAGLLIISPFAVFHLFLFCLLLTFAEGFVGDFRILLKQLSIIFGGAIILSAFWYDAVLLKNIVFIEYIRYVIDKVVIIIPFLLPLIFVMSVGLFFTFNRWEEGKRMFIIIGFFLLEMMFFNVAGFLGLQGFFHPERFFIEFGFASSLFFAFFIILVVKMFWNMRFTVEERREWRGKLPTAKKIGVGLLGALVVVASVLTWRYMNQATDSLLFSIGIGGAEQVINTTDIFSVVVSFASVAIFILLMYIVAKYPAEK